MDFVSAKILYLIPIAAIFVLSAFLYSRGKRKKWLNAILGNRLEEEGAVTLSHSMRRNRAILLFLMMTLLIFAWARPYWSQRLTPEMPRGRDIIVLFDVSKSMLSDDVAPSRIEHGKFLLRQLTNSANEDRFGIAAFAGASYLSCPLTSNRTALNEYIDELNCELVPLGGTNLADALKKAFEAFKAAEGNHRAIVLITDGDELTGSAEKELAKLKKMNIPVFVAGIGDPAGVPVRSGDGTVVRTKDGKIAMTKLNEQLLKAVAAATGGYYIRSTATNPGVEQLLNCIDKLDKADREGIKRKLPIDKFPQFLIAAFILYLGYMLISERSGKIGRKSAKTVIFFLLTAAFQLSAAENAPQAKQNDENVTAQQLYNKALEEQTKGKDATDLYAETLHKAEKFPIVQSKSYYNLAVQSHSAARNNISKAESLINSQQLDNASKELDEAEKNLNAAAPNYNTAFSYNCDTAKENLSGDNLTAHYLDLKKVKELKKKIQDLKKQQQKAQQDTRTAQQQNKDKKQNQQQKQQSIDKAKQSAQDLQNKADNMNQKELAKKAQQAKESLEKASEANQKNNQKETQKHLDDAAKALGADQNNKGKQEQKQQQGKSKDKKEDKPLEQQAPQAGDKGNKNEQKIDQRSAEQLLDMLKKDEQQRRNELMKRARQRRIVVEKDW